MNNNTGIDGLIAFIRAMVNDPNKRSERHWHWLAIKWARSLQDEQQQIAFEYLRQVETAYDLKQRSQLKTSELSEPWMDYANGSNFYTRRASAGGIFSILRRTNDLKFHMAWQPFWGIVYLSAWSAWHGGQAVSISDLSGVLMSHRIIARIDDEATDGLLFADIESQIEDMDAGLFEPKLRTIGYVDPDGLRLILKKGREARAKDKRRADRKREKDKRRERLEAEARDTPHNPVNIPIKHCACSSCYGARLRRDQSRKHAWNAVAYPRPNREERQANRLAPLLQRARWYTCKACLLRRSIWAWKRPDLESIEDMERRFCIRCGHDQRPDSLFREYGVQRPNCACTVCSARRIRGRHITNS